MLQQLTKPQLRTKHRLLTKPRLLRQTQLPQTLLADRLLSYCRMMILMETLEKTRISLTLKRKCRLPSFAPSKKSQGPLRHLLLRKKESKSRLLDLFKTQLELQKMKIAVLCVRPSKERFKEERTNLPKLTHQFKFSLLRTADPLDTTFSLRLAGLHLTYPRANNPVQGWVKSEKKLQLQQHQGILVLEASG